NVVDHLTPVERRRGAGAENVLRLIEGSVVQLVPAAVEVAHGGGEEEAGGIDPPLRQGLESGADGEQLAANCARPAIPFAGGDQAADKVLFHQEIRIEGQYPVRSGAADPLVLGLGEP